MLNKDCNHFEFKISITEKTWYQNFSIQIEKRLKLDQNRESPDQRGSETINKSEMRKADKEDVLISIEIQNPFFLSMRAPNSLDGVLDGGKIKSFSVVLTIFLIFLSLNQHGPAVG